MHVSRVLHDEQAARRCRRALAPPLCYGAASSNPCTPPSTQLRQDRRGGSKLLVHVVCLPCERSRRGNLPGYLPEDLSFSARRTAASNRPHRQSGGRMIAPGTCFVSLGRNVLRRPRPDARPCLTCQSVCTVKKTRERALRHNCSGPLLCRPPWRLSSRSRTSAPFQTTDRARPAHPSGDRQSSCRWRRGICAEGPLQM